MRHELMGEKIRLDKFPASVILHFLAHPATRFLLYEVMVGTSVCAYL